MDFPLARGGNRFVQLVIDCPWIKPRCPVLKSSAPPLHHLLHCQGWQCGLMGRGSPGPHGEQHPGLASWHSY